MQRNYAKMTFRSKVLWRESLPVFREWREGLIVQSDALDFLSALSADIADVIFLDPPFNLGKRYGQLDKDLDRRPAAEYQRFIIQVLSECVRIMKPGSALFLYHIPHWALKFGAFLDTKLLFRHWIAVSMKNGFARGARLYPAHYALLYFTRGMPASFKRPKIAPPRCRHCGQYIKDYGGYVKYIHTGINLTDVWDDLSPVRHRGYKSLPSNELPVKLVRRALQMAGKPGGLVVDPFVGSGTTLVAAADEGMHFAVCDSDELACEVASGRYSKLAPGQRRTVYREQLYK